MPDWAVVGFWIKNLVGALILLPAGPIILVGIGLWVARSRRGIGLGLASFGLAILVAFSLPVVANGIARFSEREFPPLGPDVALPANAAIVVLGGGMQRGATDYGGETVDPVTLARLRSAARLAIRTRLPVLVTGGRPFRSRTSEAEEMAGALIRDFRVPVKWMETQSRDTAGNARLSVPILQAAGIGTAIVVTDVEHMARARKLFEAAGMPVIPAPTDYYANGPVTVLSFIPSANALRRSAWSIHERAGQLWNRIQ